MAPPTKAAPRAGGSALDRLPLAGKLGLGALLLSLGVAVYYVGFYGEIESEIANAKAKEGSLQNDLTAAKEAREAYQKDLAEKVRLEERASEQKEMLPDQAETPSFLSSIQNAATASGVVLTSWTPIQEVSQQFYAKVPMKITASGQFHQIAKFFHTLSQVRRLINVEDIQIKRVARRDKNSNTLDEVRVDVECLATAFRALGNAPADAGGGRRRGGGQ